jgi:glycosyltransferase involved in cell wall biosynthesis
MELFVALKEAGLMPAVEKRERLTITAINNSEYRASTTGTSRFLVKSNGTPLCAVKKLAVMGPYNIDSMLEFQRLLREKHVTMVPEIYGVYRTETDVYIVEEYVRGESLERLLRSGTISINLAVDVITEIFHKLQSIDVDQSELESVKNEELQLIFNTLAGLEADPQVKSQLADDIRRYSDQLFNRLCFTNGDFILRNIIYNDGVAHLVDFDLSRKTCAPWVELLRLIRYANHSGIQISAKVFADLLPAGMPIELLTTIMHLIEMGLQKSILNAAYYKDLNVTLTAEFRELVYKLYSFDDSQPIIHSNANELSRYVQIFWTENEEEAFSEKKTLRKDIQYDQWATYEFDLSVNRLQSLRLDPMNHYGFVEISRFEISGDDGNVKRAMAFDQVAFQGSLDGFWLGRLCGFSFGEDPQIVIHSIDLTGPVKITVDMRISEMPGKILADDYLERRKQYENMANELEEYRRKIEELQENLESVNRTVESLKDTNQKLIGEQEILLANNQKLTKDLETLLSSRSWKWSKPIRIVGRMARSILAKMRTMKRKFLAGRKVELVPLNHLEHVGGDEWRSVGNDPHFEWRKPLLGGRVKIRIEGKGEKVTPLQLYYDTGDGYKETQVIEVGHLSNEWVVSNRFVKLPKHLASLRLDIGEHIQTFHLGEVCARRSSRAEKLLFLVAEYFRLHGFSVGTVRRLMISVLNTVRQQGLSGLLQKTKQFAIRSPYGELPDYQAFLQQEAEMTETEESMRQTIGSFPYKPLVSVLVPVYNVDAEWLELCVQSVRKQVYENWELCIVDDCSTKSHIRPMLEKYASEDSRIKVKFRETNGHISRASNDALEMAAGEFIALLDNDDELSPNALYENVKLLNQYPDTDIIYSDEDKITIKGERHSPFFKPDWSPDLLLSQMYTCHLTVYRKSLVEQAGGFRVGFEGSQDYDLMLRVSELTNRIRHIPKILYHWRTIPSSTSMAASSKNYTHWAGLRALEEAVKRRKLAATVHEIEGYSNMYLLRYLPIGNPKISIIIPTRNMAEIISNCLQSIFDKTTYNNFEVIVIDNGSDDQENFKLYDEWKKREPQRFAVYEYDIPFNYSKINNYGVSKATGELVLLLNNDVEVITPDWLTEMAGQAIRPEIGVVGACLYYPDNTVQHGGVILGIGGVANHSHKHFSAEHPGYFGRLKVVSNYSAVTGACLMTKKEIYEEVGGLEEILEVAFNDVDFCLKVRERGYYNIWLPHVQLYHHESKSRGAEDTPEKQARFLGEIEYMLQKWGNVLKRDPFYNPNLTYTREDFSLGNPYIPNEEQAVVK